MINYQNTLYALILTGAFLTVSTMDYNDIHAQPLDWSQQQKQTLTNLYQHYSPEKAQLLAEFYNVHDARNHCRTQKQTNNQKQFDDCLAEQTK